MPSIFSCGHLRGACAQRKTRGKRSIPRNSNIELRAIPVRNRRSSFSAGEQVCGALAGKVGTMADTVVELKTGTSQEATSSTTGTTEQQTSRRKTSCKDGVERLRQAADKQVGQNWEELAFLMTAKALSGDLACAKALVALAAGKKPRPKRAKKRPGLTQAQRYAAEPQWQGKEEEEEEA